MSPTKIAIISPTRRQGETTLSTLLGLSLSYALKEKTVCLTATGSDHLSLRTFLGIPEVFDFTKSPQRMMTLLENGSMDPEQMYDYLEQISGRVFALMSLGEGSSSAEGDALFSASLPYLDQDVIVTDCCGSSVDSPVIMKIYEEYDLIIIAVGQDVVVQNKLLKWMQSNAFPDPSKVVFVQTLYHPYVGDERALSRALGIPQRAKVSKMTLNPHLRMMMNNGNLMKCFEQIIDKDDRVIELWYDLKSITEMVGAHLLLPVDWGD